MGEQHTPEDDFAELRLRVLMMFLAERGQSQFAGIPLTRPDVANHTSDQVEKARTEVWQWFGRDRATSRLSTGMWAYLESRFNVGSRADPQGITRAEQIRRALLDAERGNIRPGLFTQLWTELTEGSATLP